MEICLTPRQRELADLAERLGDEFAETAGHHDRENTFPVDNWRRMQEERYLHLMVPAELGGGDGSLFELLLVQERLAMGDGATALAVNMHMSPTGQLAMGWRRTRDPHVEELLRGIVENRVIIASCTSEPGYGGALWDCATTATKVDDGWVVNGRKIFFTESPVCTHLISTARYEDPELGPRIVSYRLARDTPGVSVKQTWDTMGMRATQSNDLVLEDVWVPDHAVFHSWPVNHYDGGAVRTIFSWAVPSFGAVSLGVAAGGMRWVRRNVMERGRREDPEVQHLFAEMEVLLESARSVLFRHAEDVRSGAMFEQMTVQQALARGNLAKYVACTNALEIMDRVMEVAGGMGYHKRFPVERMYRDVRAGAIMPFNNPEARKLFGRTCLDIEIAPAVGFEESGLRSRPVRTDAAPVG